MQVAIPEFDGRIVGVPISFKEPLPGVAAAVGTEVLHYAPDLRALRPARAPGRAPRAARDAAARGAAHGDRAVLLPHQARARRQRGRARHAGERHARCSTRSAAAGHHVEHDFADGDALVHALIAAGGHDHDFLSDDQLGAADGAAARGRLRALVRHAARRAARGRGGDLGPAAGRVVPRRERLRDRRACGSATSSWPSSPRAATARTRSRSTTTRTSRPRTTTSPPTAGSTPCSAPTRSSTSASTGRWSGCPARRSACRPPARPTPAWATRRSSTRSWSTTRARACRPSAARTPCSIDHLVPPMMRAETYDELARLEQLLDEYARAEALDPAKLPALANRIWTLLHEAELHRDLELEQTEQPALDDFGALIEHVDGYLCEIKDLQVRDGLHVLGVAARGRAAARAARGRPAAAGPAAGAGRGVRARRGGAAGRRRRRAGRRPAAGPARALPGTGRHRRATSSTGCRTPRTRCSSAFEAAGFDPGGGAAPSAPRRWAPRTRPWSRCSSWPAARWCRSCSPPRARSPRWSAGCTAATSPRAPRAPPPAGGSTCSRPAATCTPSTRARCPATSPTRRARGWPTRCWPASRQLPETVGLVVWGTAAMRTAGDDAGEVLALLGVRPVLAPRDAPDHRPGADPAGGARPPARRRHRPHLGLLPRRVPPPRRPAGRRGHARGRARRAARAQLRAQARARRPGRAGRGAGRGGGLAARHGAHLRRPPGHLRHGPAPARRRAQLARRRRPRGGLRGVGRPRLRPRPRRRGGARGDAAPVRAHRRRGQERRHARARPARLERLLRRARRHDRLRPAPRGGRSARRDRRRLRPRARPGALAGGGGAARLPRPRGQPALDRLDDAPRVQGRVRAVGHGRLPVRLRRHHGRGRGLDVQRRRAPLRGRARGARLPAPLEPVGAAGDRRAAAGGGRPRAVGGAGRGRPRAAARRLPRGGGRAGGGAAARDATAFPFSAIVGQEALCEALLACAVDPAIGGVLVRGERGTAKTTAVRGLAPLLPPVRVRAGDRYAADPDLGEVSPDGAGGEVVARPARLVELPVGATADRVLGTLDLDRALADARARVPARAAGRGPPRDPLRGRGQPPPRPPRRRAPRRRRARPQPRRARRPVGRPSRPLRARGDHEPRGGRAAAPAARPLRAVRRGGRQPGPGRADGDRPPPARLRPRPGRVRRRVGAAPTGRSRSASPPPGSGCPPCASATGRC